MSKPENIRINILTHGLGVGPLSEEELKTIKRTIQDFGVNSVKEDIKIIQAFAKK